MLALKILRAMVSMCVTERYLLSWGMRLHARSSNSFECLKSSIFFYYLFIYYYYFLIPHLTVMVVTMIR